MLGLSPPGVDPIVPLPREEAEPRPAVAYRDSDLPSEPLPEPVSLEPSNVMASPMPFSREDIPVAVVTRSEVPPAFVTPQRPGSEPEIGSIDLALQSVAAVESRVSSSSDNIPVVHSESGMLSEAVSTQPSPVAAALPQAWPPGALPPAALPPAWPPGALPPGAPPPALPPGAPPAGAPEAAWEPRPIPSHEGLAQTFNLAAPLPPAVAPGPEPARLDVHPSATDWNQTAGAHTVTSGAAWTQPNHEVVEDPRAVFSATTPQGEAPREPKPTPQAQSSSGFGMVMGLVLGIALLSAAALGAVLVFTPESNLAQTVRDIFGMSRPGANAPHAPLGKENSPPPAEPPSALNDGVAPSGVEEDSVADAVATALVVDEAPSAEGAAPTGAAASDAPAEEPASDDTEDEATDDAEEARAVRSAPLEPGFDGVPDSVDQGRLAYLVRLAIRRAEKCHLGGRAVGTANVVLTFGADGRVSDAKVVGSPLEGAPVAACIENRTRAVVVKPYEGAPFTYTAEITLR